MDVAISCTCPGSPHDGDTVTLRDRLPFTEATAITKAVSLIEEQDPKLRPALVLATLSEWYVLMGVAAWTFVDDAGTPVPVSTAASRSLLLEHPDVLSIIEAADELYQEQILLPLLRRASLSSPPLPTDEPTSPKQPGETPRPRKQSKPSSISTIPTADTEATSSSLDGVSNSSQSSESAA